MKRLNTNINILKDKTKFNNTKDLTKNFLDLNIEENEKTNEKTDKGNNLKKMKRLHTTFFVARPSALLEEKEDILMTLAKKEHKLNDYSKNKESITFPERQNVLQWGIQVLEPMELNEYDKTSIFHRFCTAYDYIMEKMFLLNQFIKDKNELKLMVTTILLLAYKCEGLVLAKLTISNLISSFLKDMKNNKNELIDIINYNEMKILKILDYNPQVINDNNIHQLSYILYDLFTSKFLLKLNEKEEKKIKNALDFINKSIEFSDKILFKYYPMDKAMLSFYSAVEYCCIKKQSVLDSLKKYNRYLRNNLQLIKMAKEDFDKYCIRFAKIMYKNKI